MLWEAWQQDYGPKPEIAAKPVGTSMETRKEELPDTTRSETTGGAEAAVIASQPKIEEKGASIRIETDVLRLEIDTKGGDIRIADLRRYPVSLEEPNTPVRLFDEATEKLFTAQSGLIASGSMGPTHHSPLQAERSEYLLKDGETELRVPLTWTGEKGIRVTKTYVFQRGSYLIGLEHEISNQSAGLWRGRQYQQLLRKAVSSGNGNTFIRTYTGGVLYTNEDKYEKIDFSDMASGNLSRNAVGGWTAMIQHYFAAAWVPPPDQENHFYTKDLKDGRFIIGSSSAQAEVPPGETKVLKAELFVGPKIQSRMEKVAEGLELTVDYGVLTFIGKPIFWLLEKINRLGGSWGWAIIGVTLVIKLLFFKLSETSYRSMAKMRKLQPRLTTLRERFADDRQRFNQEMMTLYRKEKVNPLGGCLPILVQIPVFISLYWVLIETVELRQASFFWVPDLSVMDPFFILPVLMGVSMFFQQRLNPAPIDPIQAKVIKMFPIMFTVFCLFFPAGLVLYWTVNNTLSIAQQWYITRRIEKGEE